MTQDTSPHRVWGNHLLRSRPDSKLTLTRCTSSTCAQLLCRFNEVRIRSRSLSGYSSGKSSCQQAVPQQLCLQPNIYTCTYYPYVYAWLCKHETRIGHLYVASHVVFQTSTCQVHSNMKACMLAVMRMHLYVPFLHHVLACRAALQ